MWEKCVPVAACCDGLWQNFNTPKTITITTQSPCCSCSSCCWGDLFKKRKRLGSVVSNWIGM